MFGKNPTRPVERNPQSLAIQEIFFTLQGEGPFSGLRALFIRLAGCNLACHFCDTEFESNSGNYLSIPHILKSADFACGMDLRKRKLVVLTGGEPLRQDISGLVRYLLASGTEVVQIETAGTLWPFEGDTDEEMCSYATSGQMVLVCSPKTNKVHPRIAELCYHWKYVVTAGETDPDDGLPNRGTQCSNKDKVVRIYRPEERQAWRGQTTHIWISPRDDHEPASTQKNVEQARDLCLEHADYRLSLQTHKLVGLP